MAKAPCDTKGCGEEAEYCARVPDDRGLIYAVNLCPDCKGVASKNFPALEIVALYRVSRALLAPAV